MRVLGFPGSFPWPLVRTVTVRLSCNFHVSTFPLLANIVFMFSSSHSSSIPLSILFKARNVYNERQLRYSASSPTLSSSFGVLRWLICFRDAHPHLLFTISFFCQSHSASDLSLLGTHLTEVLIQLFNTCLEVSVTKPFLRWPCLCCKSPVAKSQMIEVLTPPSNQAIASMACPSSNEWGRKLVWSQQ